MIQEYFFSFFSEARRVEKFFQACKNDAGEATLQELGKLMFESHDSLQKLYECSHPQLDQLVELSRDLTFGARLTGAGWGGCMVALIPSQNVDEYINTLRDKFYQEHGAAERVDSLVFITAPKAGACIYSV